MTLQTALVAVGGNSLIRAGQRGTVAEQMENARIISRQIVSLMRRGLTMVITHGNGPQVGAALTRSERAADHAYEHGLDVCVATTQGEIGYILQQSLQREIALAGMSRQVVAVVTQVRVDPKDPAFQHPTKPIGPFFSEEAAEEKKQQYGWSMVEDSARGYRRVVASPEPLEIVEAEAIGKILGQGVLVIATGGGGIPVARDDSGLKGMDAVIDKDKTSALLARQLGVDLLVFSTDADAVYLDFNKPTARALRETTTAELMRHHDEGQFPPGSMGPKVRSVCSFVEQGGKRAIITSLDRLGDSVRGEAGTHILPAGAGEAEAL
ncbi:MAG: carbamate kinase [Myxococcota bacterium]